MKKTLALVLLLLLLVGCTAASPASDVSSQPVSASIPPAVVVSTLPPSAASASAPAASGSSASGAASASSVPRTFRLTIPEGYTLARIALTLEKEGVCTSAEFIAAAQAFDAGAYSLPAAQAQSEQRCFKLEGYLFPDTYELYTDTTPEAVIKNMLNNMEKRMDEGLRGQIAQSGFTVDEILTLASMIEKEAKGEGEMNNISSVFHNRLAIGQKLESDVTITYVEGAIKPFIDGDIDRYNVYYNTYKCPALPAGAICNPGLAAIKAALNPADTNYLFFVTDQGGNFYYATTYEEHQENIIKAGA